MMQAGPVRAPHTLIVERESRIVAIHSGGEFSRLPSRPLSCQPPAGPLRFGLQGKLQDDCERPTRQQVNSDDE